MEENRVTPSFGAPQESCVPKAKEDRKKYTADGRDRVMLFPVWGVGTVVASLLLGPGMPGLGIPLCVALWYGALFLYRGRGGVQSRASLPLLLAVGALALSFAIWSNRWLRGWNLVFLLGLMAIQMVEMFGLGGWAWSRPQMLIERGYLVLQGLLGHFPAVVTAVCGNKEEKSGKKRWKTVLFALGLTLPIFALAVGLLVQADQYFAYVVERLAERLGEIFGDGVIRLLIGLVLLPFLFGLCYALRHGEKQKEKEGLALPGIDPAVSVIALGMMDLLYGFFLAVQSAALFGGAAYLERVAGLSYAEYARSGFFQLVFVALLNLAVVLAAVQFSGKERGAWRVLQLLCTAMIVMSAVILVSAACKMTLYVRVYGLSFKRFLTYWGMVMLGIFFLAAAMKVWKKEFSFFKVLLTVSIAGWLALNACNVDWIVAKYNVDLYQRQEAVTIDLDYLIHNLSYDALDALEETINPWNRKAASAMQARRAQAAEDCSHWQTWSLSAYLAARR